VHTWTCPGSSRGLLTLDFVRVRLATNTFSRLRTVRELSALGTSLTWTCLNVCNLVHEQEETKRSCQIHAFEKKHWRLSHRDYVFMTHNFSLKNEPITVLSASMCLTPLGINRSEGRQWRKRIGRRRSWQLLDTLFDEQGWNWCTSTEKLERKPFQYSSTGYCLQSRNS
jgi:hypothetical protein